MNPAVSFDRFVAVAEQDGRIFFGVLQAAQTMVSWWLRVILVGLLFIPVVIFAQIVPFLFRRHLAIIFPLLPDVKERESLAWVKEVLLLYYHVLKGYRTFCLFRRSINALMDEVDEHIDSLSYALEHAGFLQHAVEKIEHPR